MESSFIHFLPLILIDSSVAVSPFLNVYPNINLGIITPNCGAPISSSVLKTIPIVSEYSSVPKDKLFKIGSKILIFIPL